MPKALPCDLNQCLNGAKCINDNLGSYVCACERGYTGKNCETGWLLALD